MSRPQLRVDVEPLSPPGGNEDAAIIKLVSTAQRLDVVLMTAIVRPQHSPDARKSAMVVAQEQADQIRLALGIHRKFIVRSGNGKVICHVAAFDMVEVLRQLVEGSPTLFHAQSSITISTMEPGE